MPLAKLRNDSVLFRWSTHIRTRLSRFVVGTAFLILGILAGMKALDTYWKERDEANLRQLNALVSGYSQNSGRKPDVNLIDLYRSGLTTRRLQPTPYGGFYRYDSKSGLVYNPHRFESRPNSIQSVSLHR